MNSAALLTWPLRIALVGCLALPVLRAQDKDTPPPPPPPGENKPKPPGDDPRRPSMQRPGGNMPGGGFFPRGGDHDRMEGFRELPEEERQKVRAAFEKVWNDPEVIAARDQLMKANEEYRQKLHAALEKADPDVVKILEKAKPPGPRMPDPADPEFAKKAVQRLAMEIQFWAQQQPGSGDRRGEFVMRIHERLMAVAAVREALQQLEKADPAHRIEAWNHLRDTYQAAAKTEFPRAGNREGHRREGPPENKPGPPPVPQPPQQDKPKE